jgi:hypothetical protein
MTRPHGPWSEKRQAGGIGVEEFWKHGANESFTGEMKIKML